MWGSLLLDRVKLGMLGIILAGITAFCIHHYLVTAELKSLRESNTKYVVSMEQLQEKYDQLVIDNNHQVDQFKNTIKLQNEKIATYQSDIDKNNILAGNLTTEYEIRIKALEGNVSDYKRKLYMKPVNNTCIDGFGLIFQEIKDNASW